jgi:hypothetical protein
MKKLLLHLTAIGLCVLVTAAGARAQVYVVNLGQVGPGTDLSANLNFPAGTEAFIGIMQLTDDVTVGSGLGFSFNTLGSTADTEIAIYGPAGQTLIAMNDDGASGTWGDPGFDSVLQFGDAEPGNGDGYDGNTNQGGIWTNPVDLPAGIYTLILSTYSTIWDQYDARDTTTGSRDTGAAVVNISCFSVP